MMTPGRMGNGSAWVQSTRKDVMGEKGRWKREGRDRGDREERGGECQNAGDLALSIFLAQCMGMCGRKAGWSIPKSVGLGAELLLPSLCHWAALQSVTSCPLDASF